FSAIDLDAHAETWAKSNDKPRNEPYFWPFHNTIMAVCFTLHDAGWRERFEIIFDENVIFGPRAKYWYPLMLDLMRFKEPEASALMPIDPIFRSDDEFMPLQAADLFTTGRRYATDNPDWKELEWLLKEMPSVKETSYSQYYDRERMEAVTSESYRLAREGAAPREIIEKYRELWDKR